MYAFGYSHQSETRLSPGKLVSSGEAEKWIPEHSTWL